MRTIIDTPDDLTELKIREEKPVFSTHIDTVLEWTPSVLSLGLACRQEKQLTDLLSPAVRFLLALCLQKATVDLLKKSTRHIRPNGSFKRNSFPSGHTATGFMGAELLRQQWHGAPPLFRLSGYALALATGAIRLFKNKHWLSDVMAGAAIGWLSVKLAARAGSALETAMQKSKQDPSDNQPKP